MKAVLLFLVGGTPGHKACVLRQIEMIFIECECESMDNYCPTPSQFSIGMLKSIFKLAQRYWITCTFDCGQSVVNDTSVSCSATLCAENDEFCTVVVSALSWRDHVTVGSWKLVAQNPRSHCFDVIFICGIILNKSNELIKNGYREVRCHNDFKSFSRLF